MQTICHSALLLNKQAQVYGDREAFIYKDFGGTEWKSVSWNQAARTVQQVANAMLNLGIKVQEKIGIFSQNSLQFIYTDHAAWGIRACTIPFYSTSSEEQIQFIVNDAQIRFVFAGDQEQYDKARHLFAVCPTLEKVIVYNNKVAIPDHDPVSIYFDDFLKLGEGMPRQTELEELYNQANDDDLMSIIYTSGTTGNSKGVILTHGQARAAMIGNAVLKLSDEDRVLHFLPFAHILEKAWNLLCVVRGSHMIILTNPREVQEAMRETHPTCMCSVPRFWEKVYGAVQAQIDGAGPVKRKIFLHALEVGRKHNIEYLSRGKRPPLSLSMEYKLINKTIFSLIRKEMGLPNPHFFPTAGAAVSPEVEEFVHSIGIYMMVGYGLTESFATASNDHPDGVPYTVGSIGRPLPGLSIKIAEDGEILLKGPTITKGYYNRPEINEQAFTEDGYFRTGDVGYLKDGELYMTERKKDLFKTSNGKYIAPQMIESKILVDKYVETITIIADERKFVAALIVPNYPLLEAWADKNGVKYADLEELCRNPKVNAMLMERIETLQQPLANYEKIKRFTLLPQHFSIENGELTNTLKIKRNVVSKNYKDVIDAMYKE